MKYLKNFDTHDAYTAYIESFKFKLLKKDNVSYCKLQKDIHFNKYISDSKVVCKYNVTSTSSSTVLRTNYEQNVFKSMEIDGVLLNELVTEYTFETIGIHTVKYELYDDTKLGGNNAPVFDNDNLIETIIPDSVITISNNVFMNCHNIKNVVLGDNITSIGFQAFMECNNLINVNIPDSVTNIGDNAFYNCSRLTSCIIGNSVTSIGAAAFQNCSGLTSCIIGNSVTSISDYAFFGCSSLISIDIPDSVTSIGSYAFSKCSSLTNITVNATIYPVLGNDVFANTNNCPIYVPSESIETYKVASGWGDYVDRIQAISK